MCTKLKLVRYQHEVYLVTALVPSLQACLANSPGKHKRIAVCISRLSIHPGNQSLLAVFLNAKLPSPSYNVIEKKSRLVSYEKQWLKKNKKK